MYVSDCSLVHGFCGGDPHRHQENVAFLYCCKKLENQREDLFSSIVHLLARGNAFLGFHERPFQLIFLSIHGAIA